MAVLRKMRVLLVRHLRNRTVLVIPILLIFVYFLKHLNDSAELTMEIEIITDTSKPKPQSLIKVIHNNDIDSKSNDIQKHVEARNNYFVPISMNKIDWHDYSLIKEDLKRKGPGEKGLPASLKEKDKALEESLYSVNGFNGALSDIISLNRSLPDLRHQGCKTKTYLEHLPTVSVVVPFHNEHWSTLLRTVYSVLNRSPPQLLKEIFLVDDASTKEFLKGKLDKYVAKYLPKVHVIRLENRSGLITARLAGAKRVTSDVFVCLDSHTEATHNWLPPLLEPIAQNPRTVVCPFIDIIAYDTFEYRIQDTGARGAFDWEFFYKRLPILPKDVQNMPEPFESPVMAGGLFAISTKFFWELGGYDPGLDIWGGEQYELSFKIWQCGGRMVDAPCSRVGHIYRKYAPFPNPGHGDFVGKNYRRVAEVWMDEYAQYLYSRRPHYKKIDPGDISDQKALREKLKCKPFKWFITQIAFDLPAKYPPVDPEPYALGRIRPATDPKLCVDAHHGNSMDKLKLRPCAENSAAEQKFVFGWFKDIKSQSRNMCWDLPDSKARSPVLLYACHSDMGNQGWRYYPEDKQIVHVDANKCLAWDRPTLSLFVDECDEASETQRWMVDQINISMMEMWDKNRLKVTGPLEMIE